VPSGFGETSVQYVPEIGRWMFLAEELQRQGNHPGVPEQAEPLVRQLAGELVALGARVETGRFGADMKVSLVNDGPVTLVVET
jgi:hypothetical protein